jgi:hypothetical protein
MDGTHQQVLTLLVLTGIEARLEQLSNLRKVVGHIWRDWSRLGAHALGGQKYGLRGLGKYYNNSVSGFPGNWIE